MERSFRRRARNLLAHPRMGPRMGWIRAPQRLAPSALLALALLNAAAAAAREPGDPITLAWSEGDVAGMSSVLSPDEREIIGFVEYRQRRRGDLLETERVTRFRDGSSDEDRAEARIVGKTLEAVRGQSIIRDAHGRTLVDLRIDVAAGRVTGFSTNGDEREKFDERVELPAGTYWGPLIFIVLKNFDQNAVDGRLVFHTIAATPKPRSIDLEMVREGKTSVTRPGGSLDVVRFKLRPTVHWLVDPLIRRIAPETNFFLRSSAPPALARFVGPRNYGGQEILLE